jgi:hypothetical protein
MDILVGKESGISLRALESGRTPWLGKETKNYGRFSRPLGRRNRRAPCLRKGNSCRGKETKANNKKKIEDISLGEGKRNLIMHKNKRNKSVDCFVRGKEI